jgi:hypothetical protein
MQNKFADLYYGRFYQYDLILKCLGFRELYYRRRHLFVLFHFNIFKEKINCYSVVDTFKLSVSSKLVRKFSIFTVRESTAGI